MAEGKGETLHAFAALLNCEQDIFTQSIQKSYKKIVTFDNSPANLLKNVKSKAVCRNLN